MFAPVPQTASSEDAILECSSVAEHALHTGGVVGSTPITPTINEKGQLAKASWPFSRSHCLLGSVELSFRSFSSISLPEK